jgi:hypothetical protein
MTGTPIILPAAHGAISLRYHRTDRSTVETVVEARFCEEEEE